MVITDGDIARNRYVFPIHIIQNIVLNGEEAIRIHARNDCIVARGIVEPERAVFVLVQTCRPAAGRNDQQRIVLARKDQSGDAGVVIAVVVLVVPDQVIGFVKIIRGIDRQEQLFFVSIIIHLVDIRAADERVRLAVDAPDHTAVNTNVESVHESACGICRDCVSPEFLILVQVQLEYGVLRESVQREHGLSSHIAPRVVHHGGVAVHVKTRAVPSGINTVFEVEVAFDKNVSVYNDAGIERCIGQRAAIQSDNAVEYSMFEQHILIHFHCAVAVPFRILHDRALVEPAPAGVLHREVMDARTVEVVIAAFACPGHFHAVVRRQPVLTVVIADQHFACHVQDFALDIFDHIILHQEYAVLVEALDDRVVPGGIIKPEAAFFVLSRDEQASACLDLRHAAVPDPDLFRYAIVDHDQLIILAFTGKRYACYGSFCQDEDVILVQQNIIRFIFEARRHDEDQFIVFVPGQGITRDPVIPRPLFHRDRSAICPAGILDRDRAVETLRVSGEDVFSLVLVGTDDHRVVKRRQEHHVVDLNAVLLLTVRNIKFDIGVSGVYRTVDLYIRAETYRPLQDRPFFQNQCAAPRDFRVVQHAAARDADRFARLFPDQRFPGRDFRSGAYDGFFRFIRFRLMINIVFRNSQSQGIIVQIQGIRVPSVDKRTVHGQRAVVRGRILHRKHAGEVSRARCEQIVASVRIGGYRERITWIARNRIQIADQRGFRVRLGQREIDSGASICGNDRTIGQLQMSAEDRPVVKVHFGSGCDTHIFRTSAFQYQHDIVCIKHNGTCRAEAADFNRAITDSMDIPCHTFAPYDQPSAARQYGLACQTAVRNDFISLRADLCPARHTTVSYRLGSRRDDRIQAETAFRHQYFPRLPFIIPRSVPVILIFSV